MFVKICGTTNPEDAQLAVEFGADALGFIFAPSKRRVSVEQVASIAGLLPPHVLKVGVFTDADDGEISRTVKAARLGAVQMHWRYDAARVSALREKLGESVSLWQVVGFIADAPDPGETDRQFGEELRTVLLDGHVDVALLDSVKAGNSGGLGEAFSWERARSHVQAVQAEVVTRTGQRPRILLAGGLRPENVQDAVRTLEPWGVDVVSGVEAGPGKKSPDRLKAFIAAAKRS